MKDYRDEKKEDLLPKLNEEEIEWAIAPEKQAWVYNALSQGPGYVWIDAENGYAMQIGWKGFELLSIVDHPWCCLLYTSPSPRDYAASRMPSSA